MKCADLKVKNLDLSSKEKRRLSREIPMSLITKIMMTTKTLQLARELYQLMRKSKLIWIKLIYQTMLVLLVL